MGKSKLWKKYGKELDNSVNIGGVNVSFICKDVDEGDLNISSDPISIDTIDVYARQRFTKMLKEVEKYGTNKKAT